MEKFRGEIGSGESGTLDRLPNPISPLQPLDQKGRARLSIPVWEPGTDVIMRDMLRPFQLVAGALSKAGLARIRVRVSKQQVFSDGTPFDDFFRKRKVVVVFDGREDRNWGSFWDISSRFSYFYGDLAREGKSDKEIGELAKPWLKRETDRLRAFEERIRY